MAKHTIELTEEQELFLDIYLAVCPLREGHYREDYPGIVANNFINSMMKREPQFLVMYEKKYGKKFTALSDYRNLRRNQS